MFLNIIKNPVVNRFLKQDLYVIVQRLTKKSKIYYRLDHNFLSELISVLVNRWQ